MQRQQPDKHRQTRHAGQQPQRRASCLEPEISRVAAKNLCYGSYGKECASAKEGIHGSVFSAAVRLARFCLRSSHS